MQSAATTIAEIVFVANSLALAYTLFGYPLLLGLLARRTSKPVNRAPIEKTVTVLMAVHNGAAFLKDKFETLLALDYPRELVQIIVISDGSTDATSDITRSYEDRGVELIEVPRGGKPAALNAGMARARGEILFFTDVRQKMDPGCLRRLVSCFADEAIGVASGELLILRGDTRGEEDVSAYRKYENWIRRCLGRIDSIFGATGSIYAMRRELAEPLPVETLLDDMHLPMGAFFRGYRLIFDAEAIAYDYPTTLDTEFRRKVRTLAGNFQVLRAYPQLLGPANRMWVHFVSYKFARLLLPYFLILIAFSTPFLPTTLAILAGTGQIGLYGMALLDPMLHGPLKRLSSPARTFVVLVAAALFAASILFISPLQLWKETKVAAPRT